MSNSIETDRSLAFQSSGTKADEPSHVPRPTDGHNTDNAQNNLAALLSELSAKMDYVVATLDKHERAIQALDADGESWRNRRKKNRERMAKKRRKNNGTPTRETDPSVCAQANVCAQTETEKAKEEISPHTPFIGEKEKEKDASSSAAARPCAGECSVCGLYNPASPICQAVARGSFAPHAAIDVHTPPPCLPFMMLYAHKRAHFHDDNITHNFFQTVGVEWQWKDPKHGEPIGNWCGYFTRWRTNSDYFKRLHDPDRLYDARKSYNGEIRGNRFGSRDRAANYLPPTEADKRNFALPEGV